MVFSKGELSAVITLKTAPELVKELVNKLGDPTDSYWNGSHTWFNELNSARIEWRLHPVSNFKMPEASRPEDLLDLALENQIDPSHYWEGLEIFPCDGDDLDIKEFGQFIFKKIHIEPEAIGYVNHDLIGDTFERAQGNVSVIDMLLKQLKS